MLSLEMKFLPMYLPEFELLSVYYVINKTIFTLQWILR